MAGQETEADGRRPGGDRTDATDDARADIFRAGIRSGELAEDGELVAVGAGQVDR